MGAIDGAIVGIDIGNVKAGAGEDTISLSGDGAGRSTNGEIRTPASVSGAGDDIIGCRNMDSVDDYMGVC